MIPGPAFPELTTKGEQDIELVFRQAARVFEHTFHVARVHQGYVEPHATAVWIDDAGVAHFASTNKTPFALRTQLAATLGLAESAITVESQYIGGDFGGKGLSFDEFPCYYLARTTGRPIKAVMSYTDELQSANPRHAAVVKLRTGVDAQNNILCHAAEVIYDGGAYAAGKVVPTVILPGGLGTLSAYRVPHSRLEVKVAYSNTTPGGHMRSPGEPQAVFAGESHVDMIARELGIDPLEFRLQNVLRVGDADSTGTKMREVRGAELLEVARRETCWGEPKEPGTGRGIALSARHIGEGKTSVSLALQADGTIEVLTGMVDQGTGAHTLLARVTAATMSVRADRVRIRYGDTATAPYDAGSGASRVTRMLSQAAKDGGEKLKAALEWQAAEALGWQAEKVKLDGDRFTDGIESLSFDQVAARIAQTGPVTSRGKYDSEADHHDEGHFNFSCYVVESCVDPETGVVDIRQVTLIADVGTIVNPVGHQGQLEGGFMMGYGGAVMEELVIEDGKVATPNLGEYKLPTSMDIPSFRTILVPTTIGPGAYGAKSAGEVSNAGVGPALANSIADAVGARIFRLPITAEKVREAIKGSSQDGLRPPNGRSRSTP